MKKRILITGASGFIGGFLVKEALQRGYDVWAGVRRGSSREHLQDERIHLICLPYDDPAELRDVVAAAGAWHYVVHNAGVTKTLTASAFYQVNALYTRTFINSLSEAGCLPDKFLLMSSLSSYGPVCEASGRPIRTDDEQKPDTYYGKSKLQAEQFVKEQTFCDYVIFCPTGVYGPGDKDYLMELKSIQSGFDFKMGLKPQRMMFIYVKDLAVATFLALENPSVRNRSYFMSDGDVYTDHAFAGIVKELLGKRFVFKLRVPLWLGYVACFCSEWVGKIFKRAMTLNTDKYRILRQRNWVCETGQASCDFDFTPRYTLRKGLAETIRFNKEKGTL